MKKYTKLVFIAELLLLTGLSNIVLLPHVMEQWSHDRIIGVLHLILGMVTGGAGLTGIVLFVRYEFVRHGKQWRETGLRLLLWYVAIQFLAGVLQGLTALAVFRVGALPYESTKNFIYISSGIWQNLIRVLFLFLIVSALYDRDWKENKRLLKVSEAAALLLSVVTVILAFFPAGKGMEMMRVLWEVLFTTGYIRYFVIMLREEGEK